MSPSDTRLPKDETPVLNDENSLKLGIFATNLRGGACLADMEGKHLRRDQARADDRGDGCRLLRRPVLGAPEQVTEQRLHMHELGCDGLALSWPSHEEGLQQMEETILPMLVEAGARRPRETAWQTA